MLPLPSFNEKNEKNDSCEKIAKTILKKSGRISDDKKKKAKDKNTGKTKQMQNEVKKAKIR